MSFGEGIKNLSYYGASLCQRESGGSPTGGWRMP